MDCSHFAVHVGRFGVVSHITQFLRLLKLRTSIRLAEMLKTANQICRYKREPYRTSPYELGTRWDSSSLVNVCEFNMLTITPPEASRWIKSSNLLNLLLRCDTRPYEWGTRWDSSSLVKVCESNMLTITPPEESRWIKSSNLLNLLLRCDTRPYEWGTRWDSSSLVKVCESNMLTITPPEAPRWVKSFTIFWYVLVCPAYITWPTQFKSC